MDIVLSRTMDEIKESGSVVLEGSDVADAQGGSDPESEHKCKGICGKSYS